MKVEIISGEFETLVCVYCPGCKSLHPLRTKGAPGQPIWSWDGNTEAPTFSPSLLVNKSIPERRCHSFIRGGKIEFLQDCYHAMKGQTVELPDLDEDGQPL